MLFRCKGVHVYQMTLFAVEEIKNEILSILVDVWFFAGHMVTLSMLDECFLGDEWSVTNALIELISEGLVQAQEAKRKQVTFYSPSSELMQAIDKMWNEGRF